MKEVSREVLTGSGSRWPFVLNEINEIIEVTPEEMEVT